MTAAATSGAWPGLTYGATERLLADLNDTSVEGVRTRFRKLRLRPFPDEIRTGTGNRVVYDLRRLLALCAVFELNRLFVPQGHCVQLVEAHWVEWCRASLVAAHRLGLAPAATSAPDEAVSVLRLCVNAFGADEQAPQVVFTAAEQRDADDPAAPALLVHAERMVAAIGAASRDRSAASSAFGDLDAYFGWGRPELPHRAVVSEMPGRRGFLEDGPYFERAGMLLRAAAPRSTFERDRLQGVVDYLERPAPVDAWKSEVGSDEDRPRLKHLLNIHAQRLGLVVRERYPETLAIADRENVGEIALRYIADARERLIR